MLSGLDTPIGVVGELIAAGVSLSAKMHGELMRATVQRGAKHRLAVLNEDDLGPEVLKFIEGRLAKSVTLSLRTYTWREVIDEILSQALQEVGVERNRNDWKFRVPFWSQRLVEEPVSPIVPFMAAPTSRLLSVDSKLYVSAFDHEHIYARWRMIGHIDEGRDWWLPVPLNDLDPADRIRAAVRSRAALEVAP